MRSGKLKATSFKTMGIAASREWPESPPVPFGYVSVETWLPARGVKGRSGKKRKDGSHAHVGYVREASRTERLPSLRWLSQVAFRKASALAVHSPSSLERQSARKPSDASSHTTLNRCDCPGPMALMTVACSPAALEAAWTAYVMSSCRHKAKRLMVNSPIVVHLSVAARGRIRARTTRIRIPTIAIEMPVGLRDAWPPSTLRSLQLAKLQ